MKTERQTPEEIDPVGAIITLATFPEFIENGKLVVTREIALKMLQLLKDQHNKELKEIREAVKLLIKGENSKYKILIYQEDVFEIIDKHIK